MVKDFWGIIGPLDMFLGQEIKHWSVRYLAKIVRLTHRGIENDNKAGVALTNYSIDLEIQRCVFVPVELVSA